MRPQMVFDHFVVDITKGVLFVNVFLYLFQFDVLAVVLIIMKLKRDQGRLVNKNGIFYLS